MFIAVEEQKLVLPITGWNKHISNLLQKAYDDLPKNRLYIVTGSRGDRFNDILDVRDRCNLEGLDFLDRECSTLKGLELIPAIRSLTMVVDELLNNFDNLNSINTKGKNQENILRYFKKATVNQNIKWDNEFEDGLFSFIKSLFYVMSDALANNKRLFIN